jgi:hypothetical protein
MAEPVKTGPAVLPAPLKLKISFCKAQHNATPFAAIENQIFFLPWLYPT